MTQQIAFIGFGEAGQTISRGLREEGVTGMRAYDILFDDPADKRGLKHAAEALGDNEHHGHGDKDKHHDKDKNGHGDSKHHGARNDGHGEDRDHDKRAEAGEHSRKGS